MVGIRGKMATIRTDSSVSQKEESLKLIIEEQKRDYDYLLHIYNRMRAAESILLTATFGIVAYLYYSGPNGENPGILDRLFVPTEDYGRVIYFIAAGFFIYGLVKLIMNVFGNNPWMTAYESHKDSYPHKALETLEYIKIRYAECQEFNGEKYRKRKEGLNFLFYCIFISAIILMVIKTLS